MGKTGKTAPLLSLASFACFLSSSSFVCMSLLPPQLNVEVSDTLERVSAISKASRRLRVCPSINMRLSGQFWSDPLRDLIAALMNIDKLAVMRSVPIASIAWGGYCLLSLDGIESFAVGAVLIGFGAYQSMRIFRAQSWQEVPEESLGATRMMGGLLIFASASWLLDMLTDWRTYPLAEYISTLFLIGYCAYVIFRIRPSDQEVG
jgi:hypothetical protein